MPLGNTKKMLQEAQAHGAAVGAFEPYTMEQIQATVEVAEEEGEPVILQFWSEVIETWGFPMLRAVVEHVANAASVPVGFHLDHALEEDLVYRALDAGFTSVMFDGSKLPIEENIERTQKVVERAHKYGADVEAELGIIGFINQYANEEEARREVEKLLTTPEQAEFFCTQTRIDILAPAIGSIHGCPLPLARLDIPRIDAIYQTTGLPLALHGGSGVSEDQLGRAIKAGIAKVNVDAEVRTIAINSLKRAIGNIGASGVVHIDFARYPRDVKKAIKEAVRSRMRMLHPQ